MMSPIDLNGMHPFFLGALVVLVILLAVTIRRHREAILHKLGAFTFSAFFALVLGLFAHSILGKDQATSVAIVIFAGILMAIFLPGRSRHIPRQARREAISQFERRTGERYNRRRHDIDHVVPFSRGGNNSIDNLRVTTRRVNRSKQDKSPWWDLFGR